MSSLTTGSERDDGRAVVVVGAGLSGLLAARALQAEGRRVVVLDKGRSPGGRLATRRIGGAALDHGAQFFTVRTPELAVLVEEWTDAGVVREWCRGFAGRTDGHPRYVTTGGMNALAKHLAVGLDVRTGHLVTAVHPAADGLRVRLDGTGEAELPGDAVVLTAPVPQSLALCQAGGLDLGEVGRALDAIEYDPTLALLVVLDRASAVPPPGGVQPEEGIFSWVGDNQAKGVSAEPAITLHVRPDVSRRRYDDPDEVLRADLLAAAQPWLGDAAVRDAQVKRWRYATPVTLFADTTAVVRIPPTRAPLVFAGDAFAGPRVEGAARSGLAAAAAVSDHLTP